MRSSTIAKRFAKALLQVGQETGSADRFRRELVDVVAVFKGHPELYKLFLNPGYGLEERNALIDKLTACVSASAEVTRFLKAVVQTRNVKLLEEMLSAYERLEDESAGRVRALVESPAPLSAALVHELKEKLEAATGKEVVITHRKNADVIGGLIIRMGNTIMDGSLRTGLGSMKKKIAEGVA